jgi:ABC-type transport system involved in multi-copper enzyme maturation permease subunit
VKTILKREILHNLYSLRFLISLVLLLAVFLAGSFSYIKGHEAALAKYRDARSQYEEGMRKDAEANATVLAVTKRSFTLRPRDNAFLDEAKEKYMPNAVVFSAWNVFAFENKSGNANPFLNKHEDLNWGYIAALIISFIALIFTFDAVSGEKESKTLALTLSNPISRGAILFGKYLSAVATVLLLLLPAAGLNLGLVLLAGRTPFTSALVGEIGGFLVVAGLLAATMAAFGLFTSVLTRNSNVSLLLSLFLWLLFVAVIPNSSTFIAKTVFPIDSSEMVQRRINAGYEDLSKNAPSGSWAQNSGNPFMPEHELRARLQMKIMESEKGLRDAYYRTMFRQFERTRLWTALSPISLFQYSSEAVVGGGYPRFRKVWEDFHVYQPQFQSFFKDLDAKDPNSPHWYNPFEDVSTTRLKVDAAVVPQFQERPMSAGDRIRSVFPFLLLSVFIIGLVYVLSFVFFIRYDVR